MSSRLMLRLAAAMVWSAAFLALVVLPADQLAGQESVGPEIALPGGTESPGIPADPTLIAPTPIQDAGTYEEFTPGPWIGTAEQPHYWFASSRESTQSVRDGVGGLSYFERGPDGPPRDMAGMAFVDA